jgi:hypothetical protein
VSAGKIVGVGGEISFDGDGNFKKLGLEAMASDELEIDK